MLFLSCASTIKIKPENIEVRFSDPPNEFKEVGLLFASSLTGSIENLIDELKSDAADKRANGIIIIGDSLQIVKSNYIKNLTARAFVYVQNEN